MLKKVRGLTILFSSGLFFLIDQIFKYLARSHPDFSFYLLPNRLGWEFYTNNGIAFSIPLPSILILTLTPAVLLLLIYITATEKNKSPLFFLSLLLIIFGAFSNLIDRIFFQATLDYIRLYSGVINVADIMILSGAVLFVVDSFKRAKDKK